MGPKGTSGLDNVVDHGILLDKLKLYGFDEKSIKWMKNYLSGRTQAVCIDGSFSPFLSVNVGVPQGSTGATLLCDVH